MAKGLTAESVKHAKAGPTRKEIPDAYLPGLYLVVQPSGKKAWAVRYRYAGRPTKYTLGAYPAFTLSEAREAGRATLRSVAEGLDPAAVKAKAKREAITPKRSPRSQVLEFEAVTEDFIERYCKPKTVDWKNSASMLRRHFVSRWKGMNIDELQKRDVLDALAEMTDGGLGLGTNHALAQLKKMFNWLVNDEDRLKASPCIGIRKPIKHIPRSRYLSEEEIFLHWQASGKMGYPWGPYFRVLLLSGQRVTEISDLVWTEIDGNRLTLPEERTKNHRLQEFRLPTQAMAIIKALPRILITNTEGKQVTCPWLFKGSRNGPIGGFSKKSAEHAALVLELAQERARARSEDPDAIEIPHFTNHDLRRTFSTYMSKLRVPVEVTEAALNHKSGRVSGVSAVYNRWEYYEEKSEALQKWGDYVEGIVARFSGANVVELRASK